MVTVLMLGSGPTALQAAAWPRTAFSEIVAINNAWRVRDDWSCLVYPEDFPPDRRPPQIGAGQRVITAEAFVPAQNSYGGFVYAGGTMAFTASYWALEALRPSVIAYFGCDMIYPASKQTHFYGSGTADPLRRDVTLRSLEAKSCRLMAFAAQQGCALVNLSTGRSRLQFPRARLEDVVRGAVAAPPFDPRRMQRIVEQERALGYVVPSGRYWEQEHLFDADEIDRIDRQWLTLFAGEMALRGARG